jgi:hypothetical protein
VCVCVLSRRAAGCLCQQPKPPRGCAHSPTLTQSQRLPLHGHTRRVAHTGYLRLHTSLGDLNLELHCDIAPRTCENFLGLCEMGYYDDTPFHRSIKNFMIQVRVTCGTCVAHVWLCGVWASAGLVPTHTHTPRRVAFS